LCDAAQIAPAEHRRDGLRLDRSGRRVAFGGKGAKDRREKSKVREIRQSGHGLLVLECRQRVRMSAPHGSEDDPRD
jgi:hypothetical protein